MSGQAGSQRPPEPETTAPEPTAPERTAPPGPGRDRVLLVTGMSGAGHSSALKALEDMGYEAVDNMPLSLLSGLVRHEAASHRPLAIGIDIRTRDFGTSAFMAALDPLAGSSGVDLRVIFLDCEDELLRRRYTETRRRHPLAGDRPVIDGIRLERERVSPLRRRADLVIDTSALTVADLRRLLQGHFALDAALAGWLREHGKRVGIGHREIAPRTAATPTPSAPPPDTSAPAEAFKHGGALKDADAQDAGALKDTA
jgi:UPF0042 nucleotide-binding protein